MKGLLPARFVFRILLILGGMSMTQCTSHTPSAGPSDIGDSIPITGPAVQARLYGIVIDSLDVEQHTVKSGETLSRILSRYGLSSSRIHQVVLQSRPIFNVNNIRSGHAYTAMLTRDTIPALRYWVYEKDATHFVTLHFLADTIHVTEDVKEVRHIRRHLAAAIHRSLWMTVYEAGVNTSLSNLLSEIYAWQIDFFGIADGDSVNVVFDEIRIDSTSIGIGAVHAAFFRHAGKGYYAIPFIQEDSVRSYFDYDGQSLRKAFLKVPLNYSRISSTFSNRRYHPVLKIYRAHHGVDYAAPTGTPVHSIGDGVVTKRAYQKNGGGNYVTIKHNSTYSTTYMHLSKFASGIAVGTHVAQGQVIGYVGATGIATGPHLDFRVYKNGTPINPLTMESPPTEPVSERLRDRFNAVRDSLVYLLNQPVEGDL